MKTLISASLLEELHFAFAAFCRRQRRPFWDSACANKGDIGRISAF
jgi:hypothetical protein